MGLLRTVANNYFKTIFYLRLSTHGRETRTGSTRRDTLLILFLVAVFGAILYALVWDLRPYPFLGWVDDYRYVKSAWYLKHFHWLGPFEATTLVKRPLFSVFLAFTSSLGIPFDPLQSFAYLASVAYFIRTLLRFGLSRWVAVLLFAVLTFVPAIYDSDGSRVLRETVTVALEFVILSLALRLLLLPEGTELRELLWGKKSLTLYLLFTLTAFHWGMREEGILLSVVLVSSMFIFALWRFNGSTFKRIISGTVLSGMLFIFVAATYVAIASTNYAVYGVFLVNDLSEGEFPKLVGVLKSIQEGPRPELLLHPMETDKLMDLSPRFRPIGQVLQRVQQTDPNISYSYEMFFLKVTALQGTELGSSAFNTQKYFHDLRMEISDLCAQRKLICDPNPRLSVVPRYSWNQWRLIPGYIRQLSLWVITTQCTGFEFLSHSFTGVEPVPRLVFRHFVEITRQEPFGWDGRHVQYTLPGPLNSVINAQQKRKAMGEFYSSWSPGVYGLAAAALIPFTILAWRQNRREWLFILMVPALHAVARILSFSYLSAVDEGGIPVRLIKPAYPFALAAAVLAVGLTLTFIWEEIRRVPRRAPKSQL